ncbi:MAG TPA: hypothetical protein VFY25_13240, partial [Anaerolineales bacterium]|nr:hypothetical protein [Anaerolineales bacterium]
IAGGAVILIAAVVMMAWRTQQGQPGIQRAASLAGVLLLAEAIIGILMLTGGFAPLMLAAYVAAAAALWVMLVTLVVVTGLAPSN